MIVCINCKKEMKCAKTGTTVRWNEGHHVYAGDKFECSCGASVIVCNQTPYYDERETELIKKTSDKHTIFMEE